MQRQRHRSTATASTCDAGLVLGIERRAIDRVVCVRPQAKLGRIRLADQDGALALDALDKDFVVLGHVVLEQRRA
eukprot:11312-Eustigmatos_ZCMA.PRE.1